MGYNLVYTITHNTYLKNKSDKEVANIQDDIELFD